MSWQPQGGSCLRSPDSATTREADVDGDAFNAAQTMMLLMKGGSGPSSSSASDGDGGVNTSGRSVGKRRCASTYARGSKHARTSAAEADTPPVAHVTRRQSTGAVNSGEWASVKRSASTGLPAFIGASDHAPQLRPQDMRIRVQAQPAHQRAQGTRVPAASRPPLPPMYSAPFQAAPGAPSVCDGVPAPWGSGVRSSEAAPGRPPTNQGLMFYAQASRALQQKPGSLAWHSGAAPSMVAVSGGLDSAGAIPAYLCGCMCIRV